MSKEIAQAFATIRKTLETDNPSDEDKAVIAALAIAAELMALAERAVAALETIARAPGQ